MKYPFILFLFLLVLSACHKEAPAVANSDNSNTTQNTPATNNTTTPTPTSVPTQTTLPPDTVFPGSYFPAFPGSYWHYVTPNATVLTDSTASHYVKDLYTRSSAPGALTTYTSDTFYVSKFYGQTSTFCVWGSRGHTGPLSYYPNLVLIPIVSDSMQVGFKWTSNYIGNGIHAIEIGEVIKRDTTLTVQGHTYFPCIVVRYSVTSSSPPMPYTYPHRIFYYAKNVGIIKEEYQGGLTSPLEVKRELTSYYIGP